MLQLLRDLDFARVSDLSDRFGISEVTVRSDLDRLVRKGMVRRVHGGAIYDAQPLRRERPFEEQAVASAEEKAAIGTAAAALVGDGDTVIIDVGTTCTAVARALVARVDLTDVVVITNGLNIALTIEPAMPRFTVVVTGGTVRPLQHSLVDPFGGLVLDRLHADLLFLGNNGVHATAGVTNVNLPEAEMKQRMVHSARRTVAVADGSKVGAISAARVCGIDDLDRMITGASADDAALADLENTGLAIQVVT
jgi:DeoR family transcriptional regulator, aga operon transcriptional repressor